MSPNKAGRHRASREKWQLTRKGVRAPGVQACGRRLSPWSWQRLAELAYWRVGSGPTLVFVHGWPLSSATWVKLVPELSEHFTCVVFDQSGTGQTRTNGDTDYNSRGQARRLNAPRNQTACCSCSLRMVGAVGKPGPRPMASDMDAIVRELSLRVYATTLS